MNLDVSHQKKTYGSRYPKCFRSLRAWTSTLGLFREYYVLEQHDFLTELRKKRLINKKEFEAINAEGWTKVYRIPEIYFDEKKLFAARHTYFVSAGENFRKWGVPVWNLQPGTLVHLAITAMHRHKLKGQYISWHSEVLLKSKEKQLLNEVCNGYAPDALLEREGGEYWAIELLARTPGGAKKEYLDKKEKWKGSKIAKIIWLQRTEKGPNMGYKEADFGAEDSEGKEEH